MNNTGVGNAVVPNVTSGENINISAANMNVVNNQNDDSLPAVNENLKRVEINYSPPSKFKIFLMIFFLVFLVIFVLFLPEINSFVNMYLKGEKNQVEEKIMTGKSLLFIEVILKIMCDVTFKTPCYKQACSLLYHFHKKHTLLRAGRKMHLLQALYNKIQRLPNHYFKETSHLGNYLTWKVLMNF